MRCRSCWLHRQGADRLGRSGLHGPAFAPDASNSAADQAQQWGMHQRRHGVLPINGSARGLIGQNNEYTDDGLLFTDGIANWTAEKTDKSLNAHGVSIVEVTKQRGGQWRVVRPSVYGRRITGQTPITIGGPAAGDARLRTTADPTGTMVLGTLNNCAMGYTPVGHLPGVRGELQRLLQPSRPRNRSTAAGGPLRDQRSSATRATKFHDHGQALQRVNEERERAEPLRLGRRDRSVQRRLRRPSSARRLGRHEA